MSIATIEELAKQPGVDIYEYGTKAEGLAVLHKFREEIGRDIENRDTALEEQLQYHMLALEGAKSSQDPRRIGLEESRLERHKSMIARAGRNFLYYFELTPSFAVSKSSPLEESHELRKVFRGLVSSPLIFYGKMPYQVGTADDLRIVMARSSDQFEEPGKFETHFALYDPRDFDKSFRDWLNAARKVRESGAGAVIGDILVSLPFSTADYIAGRKDGDDEVAVSLESQGLESTILFGISNIGLVANTGNLFDPNGSSASLVEGLPSKIVRGDLDFSFIQNEKEGIMITHGSNQYLRKGRHSVDQYGYPQETIDVIDIREPFKPHTFRYFGNTTSMSMNFEWGGFPWPPWPEQGMHPSYMFRLLEIFKERLGKEVEIEGIFLHDGKFSNSAFPHLVQLRTYQMPENRLKELTKVPEASIVSNSIDAYIADRMEGDLWVLDNPDLDIRAAREKIRKPYILFDKTGMDSYGDSPVNLDFFQDRSGLIIPIFRQTERLMAQGHTHGYMLQTLWKLQKKGPVMAIDTPHDFLSSERYKEKLRDRFEIYNGFRIIRNVTVESDGKKAQIYFN